MSIRLNSSDDQLEYRDSDTTALTWGSTVMLWATCRGGGGNSQDCPLAIGESQAGQRKMRFSTGADLHAYTGDTTDSGLLITDFFDATNQGDWAHLAISLSELGRTTAGYADVKWWARWYNSTTYTTQEVTGTSAWWQATGRRLLIGDSFDSGGGDWFNGSVFGLKVIDFPSWPSEAELLAESLSCMPVQRDKCRVWIPMRDTNDTNSMFQTDGGAADDFNRADEQLEAGANWEIADGDGLRIVSNVVDNTSESSVTDHAVRWVGWFADDQWAEIDAVSFGDSDDAISLYLRSTGNDGNGYVAEYKGKLNSGTLTVYEVSAGTFTAIGAAVTSVGDAPARMRFECRTNGSGTDFFVYLDDVLQMSRNEATTTHSTGGPGLGQYRNASNSTCDNFNAGNLEGKGFNLDPIGILADDADNPPVAWSHGPPARQTRVVGRPDPIHQESDVSMDAVDVTLASLPANDIAVFMQYARDGTSVVGSYPTEAGTGTYTEWGTLDEQLGDAAYRLSTSSWYLESTGSGEDLSFQGGTNFAGSGIARFTPPAGVNLDWSNTITTTGSVAATHKSVTSDSTPALTGGNYFSIATTYRKTDNSTTIKAFDKFDQGLITGMVYDHTAATFEASFGAGSGFGPYKGTKQLTAVASNEITNSTGVIHWLLVPEAIVRVDDGTWQSGIGTGATPNGKDLSFTHTPTPGANRMIVVSIAAEQNVSVDSSVVVTYGGVPMTRIRWREHDDGAFWQHAGMYQLREAELGPLGDGPHTVIVDLGGGAQTNDVVAARCFQLNNVHQSVTANWENESAASSGATTVTASGFNSARTTTPGEYFLNVASNGTDNTHTWGGTETPTEIADQQLHTTMGFALSELWATSAVENQSVTTSNAPTNRLVLVSVRFSTAIPPQALLVVSNSTTPIANDELLKKELTLNGFEVTYADDDDAEVTSHPSRNDGYDLVVISESCVANPTPLSAKYLASSVPVLDMESFHLDGGTTEDWASGDGTELGDTQSTVYYDNDAGPFKWNGETVDSNVTVQTGTGIDQLFYNDNTFGAGFIPIVVEDAAFTGRIILGVYPSGSEVQGGDAAQADYAFLGFGQNWPAVWNDSSRQLFADSTRWLTRGLAADLWNSIRSQMDLAYRANEMTVTNGNYDTTQINQGTLSDPRANITANDSSIKQGVDYFGPGFDGILFAEGPGENSDKRFYIAPTAEFPTGEPGFLTVGRPTSERIKRAVSDWAETTDNFTARTSANITGLSWLAGDTIVVICGTSTTNYTLNAPTNSNLSFTLIVNDDAGTDECEAAAWYAVATTDEVNQTIVCNVSASTQLHGAAWVTDNVFVGYDDLFTEAAISEGVLPNGVFIYGMYDWNANQTTQTLTTGGTGAIPTKRSDDGDGSTFGFVMGDWIENPGGFNDIGLTDYTGLKAHQILIELDQPENPEEGITVVALGSRHELTKSFQHIRVFGETGTTTEDVGVGVDENFRFRPEVNGSGGVPPAQPDLIGVEKTLLLMQYVGRDGRSGRWALVNNQPPDINLLGSLTTWSAPMIAGLVVPQTLLSLREGVVIHAFAVMVGEMSEELRAEWWDYAQLLNDPGDLQAYPPVLPLSLLRRMSLIR